MRSPTPLLIALLVVPQLAGCPGDEFALTQVVGPDGATLSLPGGVGLVIPAGALDSDVEIGLEIVTDLAGAGYQALPDLAAAAPDVAVSLTPHGTRFAVPVSLSLPVTSAIDNLVVLRAGDESDADWTSVGPLTFDGDVATLEIDGFSAYALVRAGTCPCWNGNEVRAFQARGETLVATPPSGETWTKNADDSLSRGKNGGMRSRSTYSTYRKFAEVDAIYASLLADHHASGTGRVFRSECQVLLTRNGASAPSLAADWGGVEPVVRDVETHEFETCRALLLAGHRGVAGRQIGVETTGLPSGETVGLDVAGVSMTIETDGLVFAPRIWDQGDPYTVTITAQPTTVVCAPVTSTGTFGAENLLVDLTCAPPPPCTDADADGVTDCGPDGTRGTADDDCDDADPARFPGNTEACDGVDNDCDGQVDPGESTDADADGVPDFCDAHPNAGCPTFDLAYAREVAALPGAVCLVGATGAAVPAAFVGWDDFSGAFVEYSQSAWEVAGVATFSGAFGARAGCKDTSGSACAGRPAAGDDSIVPEADYQACKGVAEYACR